jgi:hypothetical protein
MLREYARPPSMWHRSEPAFVTTLNSLEPHLLVLGQQNWENMPKLEGVAGDLLTNGAGRYADTWQYPTRAGKRTLAFHVKHPSSWGFNFRHSFRCLGRPERKHMQCVRR